MAWHLPSPACQSAHTRHPRPATLTRSSSIPWSATQKRRGTPNAAARATSSSPCDAPDAAARAASPSPPPPPSSLDPNPFAPVNKIGLARSAKEAVLGGQRGCVVWLTGLSGAGKSTVAEAMEAVLAKRGVASALLDGDALRTGLCAGLRFSPEDRAENVRRAGEAALLAAEAGLVALAALVSPYAAGRGGVRARCKEAGVPFVEVHVATTLPVCAARDVKGLYAAAEEGRLPGLTGVCPSAPYEAPACPEVRLAGEGDLGASAAEVLAYLEVAGLIPGQEDTRRREKETGLVANNAVPFSTTGSHEC